MATQSKAETSKPQKEMNEWRDIIQKAYQTETELQARFDEGKDLTVEQRRTLRAAKSLTRKYSVSGKRKSRR